MPGSKDAYYFPHDSNARQDVRTLKLRVKHGWSGYGLYWGIVEALRDQSNYKFDADDKPFISLCVGCTEQDLAPVLETCLEVGLLVERNGYIYSESLLKRMEHLDNVRKKRKAAGAKGGKVSKTEANAQANDEANDEANAKQKPSSKGKEIKGKESKGNKEKEKEKDLLARFETYWAHEPKKVEKEAARKTWVQKFKKFKEFPWQNVSLHFAIREVQAAARVEEGLEKGETKQEALKWVANPKTWLNATDFSEPPPPELVPEGFEW